MFRHRFHGSVFNEPVGAFDHSDHVLTSVKIREIVAVCALVVNHAASVYFCGCDRVHIIGFLFAAGNVNAEIPGEVLELLEVREALERSAAFYAAQRRTDTDIAELQRISEYHRNIPVDEIAEVALWDKKFHLAIARATYNQQMFGILEKVFEKLTRITLPITRDRIADSVRQHEAILDAIRVHNADEARRLMSDHDRDVLASVKAYQYQNIHLFK